MTLAAAPRFEAPSHEPEPTDEATRNGAQSLLRLPAPPPNHFARVGAIVAYLLLLAAFLTVGFRANEAPVEELQVVELAPAPAEEEAPPEDVPPPPETMTLDDLPPPPALQPIAPVEQKPIEKPKPIKVEKPHERKPAPSHEARPSHERSSEREHADRKPAAAASHAEAKPGATMSQAANALHACLQRAASSVDAPRSGHVSYHASISASGSVTSFSISSSGNAALDAIASRLGGRCSSVPAPGKPGSLSGGITFSGP
jgi:periplasmic protein TonB